MKGGEKKEKEEGAGRGLETLLQKKGGVACICPWPLRSSPRGRGPMRNSTEEGCAKGKNNWEGNRRAVERKENYRVGRVGPWEPRMRGTSGTSLKRGQRPDHADSDGPAGKEGRR